MKVILVVASGAHAGKVIPISGAQFLIGRDPQCQLRPASQAISKQHCGVIVRDGQVYVRDYGSTNGTTVNEKLVRGAEVQIEDGASVKLGPLDFVVRIEASVPTTDGTPLPGSAETAALNAVKAVSAAAAKAPPQRDTTPNAAKPLKPGVAPAAKATKDGSKETPALKVPKPNAPAKSDGPEDENDKMAAMLLGMDDGDVPEGGTVTDMQLPTPGEPGKDQTPKPEDKNKKPIPGKGTAQTREDMSNAASDILRQMMRRPK